MMGGFMSPRISSPAHPSSGGGSAPAMGRGRGVTKRDNELIGQTVRIIQGPFKGYIGIVKDATDTMARVELHTSCKTINVDRNRLTGLTYVIPFGVRNFFSCLLLSISLNFHITQQLGKI